MPSRIVLALLFFHVALSGRADSKRILAAPMAAHVSSPAVRAHAALVQRRSNETTPIVQPDETTVQPDMLDLMGHCRPCDGSGRKCDASSKCQIELKTEGYKCTAYLNIVQEGQAQLHLSRCLPRKKPMLVAEDGFEKSSCQWLPESGLGCAPSPLDTCRSEVGCVVPICKVRVVTNKWRRVAIIVDFDSQQCPDEDEVESAPFLPGLESRAVFRGGSLHYRTSKIKNFFKGVDSAKVWPQPHSADHAENKGLQEHLQWLAHRFRHQAESIFEAVAAVLDPSFAADLSLHPAWKWAIGTSIQSAYNEEQFDLSNPLSGTLRQLSSRVPMQDFLASCTSSNGCRISVKGPRHKCELTVTSEAVTGIGRDDECFIRIHKCTQRSRDDVALISDGPGLEVFDRFGPNGCIPREMVDFKMGSRGTQLVLLKSPRVEDPKMLEQAISWVDDSAEGTLPPVVTAALHAPGGKVLWEGVKEAPGGKSWRNFRPGGCRDRSQVPYTDFLTSSEGSEGELESSKPISVCERRFEIPFTDLDGHPANIDLTKMYFTCSVAENSQEVVDGGEDFTGIPEQSDCSAAGLVVSSIRLDPSNEKVLTFFDEALIVSNQKWACKKARNVDCTESVQPLVEYLEHDYARNWRRRKVGGDKALQLVLGLQFPQFKRTGIESEMCISSGLKHANRLRAALLVKAFSGLVAATGSIFMGPLSFLVKLLMRIASSGFYAYESCIFEVASQFPGLRDELFDGDPAMWSYLGGKEMHKCKMTKNLALKLVKSGVKTAGVATAGGAGATGFAAGGIAVTAGVTGTSAVAGITAVSAGGASTLAAFGSTALDGALTVGKAALDVGGTSIPILGFAVGIAEAIAGVYQATAIYNWARMQTYFSCMEGEQAGMAQETQLLVKKLRDLRVELKEWMQNTLEPAVSRTKEDLTCIIGRAQDEDCPATEKMSTGSCEGHVNDARRFHRKVLELLAPVNSLGDALDTVLVKVQRAGIFQTQILKEIKKMSHEEYVKKEKREFAAELMLLPPYAALETLFPNAKYIPFGDVPGEDLLEMAKEEAEADATAKIALATGGEGSEAGAKAVMAEAVAAEKEGKTILVPIDGSVRESKSSVQDFCQVEVSRRAAGEVPRTLPMVLDDVLIEVENIRNQVEAFSKRTEVIMTGVDEFQKDVFATKARYFGD